MRTRWKCPNGCGGVLAPKRPRKDDVRRYCLPCSEKTGKLVERFSPAMAKERERKAQAARERAKKKAQREKDKVVAYYTVAGVDLIREMNKILRMKVFRNNNNWLVVRKLKSVDHGGIDLRVRRAKSWPTSRLGYCKPWANEISVTTYPGQDKWEIMEILLHEICHLFHDEGTHAHCHHGPGFKKIFREAGWEYFGDAPGLGFDNIYVGAFARLMREKEKEVA